MEPGSAFSSAIERGLLGSARMIALGADGAAAEPVPFVAVSTTRMVFPTSESPRVYVTPFTSSMSTQLAPDALQRCHWSCDSGRGRTRPDSVLKPDIGSLLCRCAEGRDGRICRRRACSRSMIGEPACIPGRGRDLRLPCERRMEEVVGRQVGLREDEVVDGATVEAAGADGAAGCGKGVVVVDRPLP